MSPARRTAAPRKRPASVSYVGSPTGDGSSTAGTVEAQDQDEQQFDLDEAKRELLGNFNSALRETSSAGHDELSKELANHFEAALLGLTEEDALKPISTSDIKASLEETFNTGAGKTSSIEEAEQARQLDEALRSFDRRETQIALEFGRRMQTEGKDQALQWLQEQLATTSHEEVQKQDIPASPGVKVPSSDTVKSRSRRLRGPPNSG